MKHIQQPRVTLLLTLAAVATFACVEGASPVVPTGPKAAESRVHRSHDSVARRLQLAARKAKYLTPQLEATLNGAEARLTAKDRARIEKARRRVAWLGTLHRDVMNEADAMVRPVRRAGKHPKSLTCQVILHSMKSAQAKMRAGGNYVEGAWTRADEERSLAEGGCSPSTRLSVFALNLSAPVPAPQEEEGDTVTGEFRPYLDQMAAALAATDGSPSSVTSAVNAVLANAASHIASDPDLDVVAGAAAIAISSAEGWNPQTYDYAGDVATKCLQDPSGYGQTANCEQLCEIEYIAADSCNQWEMMLMTPNFWLTWADWSDVSWDLIKHDFGGGIIGGDSKILETYWATGRMATVRRIIAAFGVGAVAASIMRWAWIMEQ